MSADILPAVRLRGPLARVNPLARLACALLLALPLIASLDVVSGIVALALEVPLILACRIPWRTFWLRTSPIWIAAPLGGITIALYGQTSGTVHVEWLLVRVSDGSLLLAAATVLRMLAIALPGVVLFIGVDPTDLADGLAQRARLPARFVLGALGGLRMAGLLVGDWRELETARRARGVADEGRVRRFVGMAFALVVLAIRRGSALATAMEAKAFGSARRRTWARESPWGRREWALAACGPAISAVALAAAVWAGAFNPIFGE
ncbi:energy-coupling factor transporter transmembrane component T family protein [Microbacterium indicum]|uniref:energy-coupling factor transporter transmembrane component T family protein n=1 Tax=Microbacterium indicum TaxID=358100 RepID=UPI000422C69E|nr:energy-coupling factor transporter transmembrane component T [Microbacterium indicum]